MTYCGGKLDHRGNNIFLYPYFSKFAKFVLITMKMYLLWFLLHMSIYFLYAEILIVQIHREFVNFPHMLAFSNRR